MDNTRPLVVARTYYFLFYAAAASLTPFLALYYQSLGFNGGQIGLLTGVAPLTALFAAPFWAGLADATRQHRRVLLLTISGTALAVLALSQVSSFWLLILVATSYAFFLAPIMPLVDNTVLALLGKARDTYGKQRLWGAVGWGLAAPFAGWLTGQLGLRWAFACYLALAGLGLLTAWQLPIVKTEQPRPFWKGVGELLSNRRWFVFLLVVLLSGAGLSILTNFFFLYLNELHTSSVIMGLSLTVATLSELPVLFFSGHMIRRWGPRGLLVISLLAYVIRAYGYSVATHSWQAVLLQLFHGLSFSAMWVAGVSFAHEIAPEGMGATAQGLFGSTVMGVGGITGAVVGGLLFDRFGGPGMYGISATIVLLGLVVFLVAGRGLGPAEKPARSSPPS